MADISKLDLERKCVRCGHHWAWHERTSSWLLKFAGGAEGPHGPCRFPTYPMPRCSCAAFVDPQYSASVLPAEDPQHTYHGWCPRCARDCYLAPAFEP